MSSIENNSDSIHSADSNSKSTKEWQLIEKMVMSLGQENTRARRWGIFFKLLMFAYLFFAIFLFMPREVSRPVVTSAHTALVDINGVIAEREEANADSIVTGLRDAFEAKASKSVLMRINSPGGSPVQSDFVFQEARRLNSLYPEKKLYAVITDIGASGAYYIAASADEIYANESSLVGSIGVIMGGGFGFEQALQKLGIERRLVTAGEHKSIMDPFLPVNEFERQHVQNMLNGVHQQFIDSVKLGRGDRLKEDKTTFSGLFWNGKDALNLGLVDGFGSPGYVAREIIGYEEIVDYTVRPNPVEALLGRLGAEATKTLASLFGDYGTYIQ